jgi:hypothetical protein
MPKIEVPEEQILQLLEQLSPKARREALCRLLRSAEYLDRAVERNRARIEKLACEKGLSWSQLAEEEREKLVDEILHR